MANNVKKSYSILCVYLTLHETKPSLVSLLVLLFLNKEILIVNSRNEDHCFGMADKRQPFLSRKLQFIKIA